MNSENDHDYFNVAVKLETPDKGSRRGAYCVVLEHNGAEHWVPKTLCDLKGSTLEVEHWFAQKEGMNG